jgi:hypothetical protein
LVNVLGIEPMLRPTSEMCASARSDTLALRKAESVERNEMKVVTGMP